MNFFFRMPSHLSYYFRRELVYYRLYLREGSSSQAWRHLERAHIIGQAYPFAHTQVHWLMLKFGFRTKNWREILGQLPRLFVGGVKSFVGKIPLGNTGGANVPALRAMPIPQDIQEMFAGKEELK